MSAAQAKARLSQLMAEVAYGGERVIIERRGKPLAALVRLDELASLEQRCLPTGEWRGFLSLAGAWGELSDEEIDEFIAHIYAEREKDMGRPVNLEL